jgi:hypothetical protein
VISDEMAARAGNQRDELLDQLVRREHDMRGADDLAGLHQRPELILPKR